jgi:hypothetical protein
MICVLGHRRCEKAETRANIFNWYELFARQSRGKVPPHVLLHPFLSDYNPFIQAVNDKLNGPTGEGLNIQLAYDGLELAGFQM